MSPMETFDAIVVGVGGMGSAALWHLARRGHRVLGVDRFGVSHDRGSSHGQTRLIRKAYFEHPAYVPLLHRAYELWRELESAAGRPLYARTGLLLLGRPDGTVIPGVKRSAAEHGLDIRDVPGAELATRFPAFQVPPDYEALYEPDAGCLAVEDCVRAHVEEAVRAGAALALGEPVTKWSASDSGVTVTTAAGSYAAERLVVCGGAWSAELLGDIGVTLEVRRKVVLWLAADRARFGPEAGFPVFCAETPEGFFYGFPVIDGDGLKVGEHTGGQAVRDADRLDRELHPDDVAPTAAFIARHLPGVSPTPVKHSVCLYTMTPDEHFVLDLHPVHRNVVIAAGFSGHGFKFASVVGSILADLATLGQTAEPIGFLSISRPALRRSQR